MACLVYSTGGKFEILPASAQAILGEFVEDGENHGRKVYRRKPVAGQQSVVLFYWDARDGKDLNGWWFGDEIGGGQVWSRSEENTISPPTKGWRCPVDGAVCKHVVCVPKMRSVSDDSSIYTEAATVGSKRPAERQSNGDTAKRPHQAEKLILESSLGDKATKAVHKLVGEYVESGTNHGKKCYKLQSDDSTVWLYFWDQRDGWEFSGWWFGSRVGGAQVFARASEQGSTPPEKGWRIPFDASVKSDVTLTLKGSPEDAEMPEDERLEKVKLMVNDVESQSDKAVEKASPFLDSSDGLLEEGVLAISDMLQSQLEALVDAKASVERHTKAAVKQDASEEFEGALASEENRLDESIAKVKEVLKKARGEVQKVELAVVEEKDSSKFDVVLVDAMDAVVQAEAAADGAHIKEDAIKALSLVKAALSTISKYAAASRSYTPEVRKIADAEFFALRDRCASVEKRMKSFSASERQARESEDVKVALAMLPEVTMLVEQAEDDVEEVAVKVGEQNAGTKVLQILGEEGMQVVEQTQIAADKAQGSITAARTLADNLVKISKQLPAAQAQPVLDDIAQLRKRTADAQKKLNPHKKARSEFNQKLRIKDEADKFNVEMVALEADVEKAAKAFASASSEEEVLTAESALPSLLATLSANMREVEEKVQSAPGTSLASLLAILERAKEARTKIDSLKTNSRDRRKELKASSLLEEAKSAVGKVEAWSAKMTKAEEPWAGNVEVVPEKTALPALDTCAKLAEEAEPEVKAAKKLVSEKLVDLRQLPEGPLRFDTQEALVKLQDKVEKIALAVSQLKRDTYARRTKLMLSDEIVAVSTAEDKIEKLAEVGKPLSEDWLVSGKEPKGMKAACSKVLEVEGGAGKEVAKARGIVEAKKKDAKFGTSPSFRTQLLKLSTRLDAAEKTHTKLKAAAGVAKDSKKTFTDQKKTLTTLTDEVDAVDLEALPLGDEEVSEEANKDLADRMHSIASKLRTWCESAKDLAEHHPHGSLNHAMQTLVDEGTKLQSRLVEARETAGKRLNRYSCEIYLKEAKTAMEQIEAGEVESKPILNKLVLALKIHCAELQRYAKTDSSSKVYADELSVLMVKAEVLQAQKQKA